MQSIECALRHVRRRVESLPAWACLLLAAAGIAALAVIVWQWQPTGDLTEYDYLFGGQKVDKARSSGRNEVIKIWSRRSTILPQFVGLTFGVYNGQKHIPVSVSEDMIGHKFGEFAPTRVFYGHAADRKAKRT